LLVPPLSYVVVNIALFGLAAFILRLFIPSATFWLFWSAGCAGALLAHVLRGWQLSGIGIRGLAAFVHVPGFILWRIWLLLGLKTKTVEWVRTDREKH
jgi:1,2-diacylglycerol 3-beta-glucosyltransferase